MAVSARFTGPASDVDLTRLLNRGLSLLAACVVVAMGAHVGMMMRSTKLGGEAESRPLTTRFIQRQPRMTKPMELRKKPRPRQRKMVRQQIELQARTSRLVTAQGGISLRSLSAPQVNLDAGAELVSIDLGGGVTDIGVSTSKEPDNKIDLNEQLLDLDFLDTGKYQAMVIQDPDNKRNIKGYLHIAQAYSARMVERLVVDADEQSGLLQFPFAMGNLVSALNEFTGIHADFSNRLSLSSRELLDVPWVFMPNMLFTPNEGELNNLGRYMQGGGFIFADAGTRDSDTDQFLRLLISDALATVGHHAQFKRLPTDHPVFHCYFDFDRPPKGTGSGHGLQFGTGEGRSTVDYIVGVEMDNRLVAIFSYQEILVAWSGVGTSGGNSGLTGFNEGTRHLQFGINIIIFALTQEGSITNRVMEVVR